MCGIAGIVHFGRTDDAPARVGRMVEAMHHRGPDGRGAWQSADVALGHARLSILDIATGAQPMFNEAGDVAVVFNGEIYNHRELRRELTALGHRFRSSHSDTEVLVHGYEQWGGDLPRRLNGMFAFAAWDARKRELFLARDRYGIKPLYVAELPHGRMVFASEVRAVLAAGLLEREPSAAGMLEYLSLQNLCGGGTLFRGVEQFPAGHWGVLTGRGLSRRQYWDFTFPRSDRRPLAESAAEHRAILERTMLRQMDADVPVVTYLSGGIDSSAITACAARLKRMPRAYSCLFQLDGVGEDRIVDEREFCRLTASHLGIEHVELECPQDALTRMLDETVSALEYPRMGMAYVNLLIAGRVARDAKVVLSGTGGDEIHGGYVYRYQYMQRHCAQPPTPRSLRGRLRETAARLLGRRIRGGARPAIRDLLNFPVKAAKLHDALTPEFLKAAGDFRAADRVDGWLDRCPSQDPLDQILYVDAKMYLHGLLVLEDKLSMAHSLEARVPLLDNELVDFMLDQPWPKMFDGERGKLLFRESVRPFVPPEVADKPKMGFGPPDASWYRTTLRGWIERQLDAKRIAARGIFQPAYVRRVLDEHFAGTVDHVATIWTLLSVESWCRQNAAFGGELEPASAGVIPMKPLQRERKSA